MEMLCPECRGTLVPQGQSATCSVCGTSFNVMFSRGQLAGSPPVPSVVRPANAAPRDSGTPAGQPDVGAEKVTIQCPQCGVRLRVPREIAGKRGRCTCGHVFTISAPPEAAVPVPPQAPPSPSPQAPATVEERPKCVQHPGTDAAYACARCHAFICGTCSFPQPDGSQLCPRCAVSPVTSPGPWQDTEAAPAVLEGVMCRVHGSVPALRRCRKCSAPICQTCDFAFPGNVHLCPTCAIASQTEISPKRKKRVYWSIGLAAWSTLGTVLFFLIISTASTPGDAEAVGVAAWVLVGIPSIIGLGVGLSCFERHLRNPPLVWGGAVWNGIIVGVWLLLILIGNFMR